MAIGETSYGPDYPAVAIRLNSLENLLRAGDPPAEDERPRRKSDQDEDKPGRTVVIIDMSV